MPAGNMPRAAAVDRGKYSIVDQDLDIRVDRRLRRFIEREVLPNTGVAASRFWMGLDNIVSELRPVNEQLLRQRDELQAAIDDWHASGRGEAQEAFLERIGYLVPSASTPAVSIRTAKVDREIAMVAGPQLVCPVDNARFVLNAANARWGSLLDALYGTNALCPHPPSGQEPYDAHRGAQVLAHVDALLDELFPLDAGTWADVCALEVRDGALRATLGASDAASSPGGGTHVFGTLRQSEQLAGYSAVGDGLGEGDGDPSRWSLLLRRHGLHVELVYDGGVGGGGEEGGESGARRGVRAGLVDVRVESALSTICDFEDSACTVDVDDKVGAYRNWLGLMRRDLRVGVHKGGDVVPRTLASPRTWRAPDGTGSVVLPGGALLLARNVGMHMPSEAVVTSDGHPVPEHFLDALVTAACALHDVYGTRSNSRHGSVYIVKPKMHGPSEVALACALFERVEYTLGLPHNTLKMGVMDEERRTSANLAATIAPASERLVFVNTGFLDRTADEIHTAMRAGPVHPKAGLKGPWYHAYEANNVATCLQARLVGRGQVGKGMWAEPEDMGAMLATKGSQLEAGASTAWVPSPVAATLHALHYLRTDVASVQASLAALADDEAAAAGELARVRRESLLIPPTMSAAEAAALTPADVQRELDDNVQGLLGYVVRWVGQGVGCSKVPNLAGTPLMEDRATLRISSQLLANWKLHGLVSDAQLDETLKRVAPLVDAQNAHEPGYRPLAPAYDGPEWHAARELIFGGVAAPNGYTEPTLTKWRRARKAIDAEMDAVADGAAAELAEGLGKVKEAQHEREDRVWSHFARSTPDGIPRHRCA